VCVMYYCQHLQSLLDEHKPLIDALNDAGSQLVELVDAPAAAAFTGLMNDDNDKYQSVTDVVQKRADKIVTQRRKSVEVCTVRRHVFDTN